MLKNTQIIPKKQFHNSVLELSKLLIESSNKNIIFQNKNNSYITDNYFNIVCNIQEKSNKSIPIVSSLIKQYCYKSEQISGNSSKYLISFSSNLLKENIKLINSNIPINDIKKTFIDFLTDFEEIYSQCVNYPTYKDLEQSIFETTNDNLSTVRGIKAISSFAIFKILPKYSFLFA